ncbi:hypothetical protein K2173_024963 [Erythroxylum novogranatense]|uniref:F-box domain-containing protein n=1 Tax=Erythroxylum novogranatense TaxID=1862640 RepID=A0AAV8UGY6_9ROSI|nr:hypothetical protein K2173_024963 [Erythroxylum novogranatense]
MHNLPFLFRSLRFGVGSTISEITLFLVIHQGFEQLEKECYFLAMETSVDFLNYLDHDMSVKILMCLEDPSDLVRFSCVSRSWRRFVVANGLSKQLCLRMFPCLHRVVHVTEPSCSFNKSLEVGCSKFMEWENLEMEHRAYSFLAQGCSSFPLTECISYAISASSTDHFPEESVHNTLEPIDMFPRSPSYWSSIGQSNPAVPETLIYKLLADICVITEIRIQPFQDYFDLGHPIYSAKAVRFRMGHAKVPLHDPIDEPLDCCLDDKFLWTYTSPEFPMAQENCLQKFELPEPVLCIGGILQVELLGRVYKHYMDGLFYICVSHVQAVGRPLWSAFGVEILEPSGKFVLKVHNYTQVSLAEEHPFARPKGVVVEEYGWNEENVESDEDVEFDFDFV